ncbi:unnamed protein product [Blepharisma stoltei]|uniref:Uncharacterized protein n=1 Tax=Blepharisma stoltei TaxID=1481888 RepID=A0AAU9IJB4_9CILI|nr:unnamed protein product [Blepharisma stoltei]
MSKLDLNSESDCEFWVDYDAHPNLDSDLSRNCKTKTISQFYPNLEDDLKDQLSSQPSQYHRERIQIIVDRIREAAKVHHQNALDLALRKIHKEYHKKIQELLQSHQNTLIELKQDYDKMRILINAKDLELDELRSFCCEQELAISKLRQKKSKEERKTEQIVHNKYDPEKDKDMKALYLKLDAMKDMVQMSQKQTDEAKAKLKSYEEFMRKREKENDEAWINKKKETEAREQELLNEIKMLKERHNSFKAEVNRELEVRQVINKKQNDLIGELQNDLKSAKLVLVTPRLHNQFIRKYRSISQDYGEVEKPKEQEVRFVKKLPIKPYTSFNRIDLKKQEVSLEYGVSTRASPACISSPDDLNITFPIVVTHTISRK